MIREFEGNRPVVGQSSYVHPTADVIGRVEIGESCWIGPGARIRGDYGRIVIGDNSCVQDNCVIHAMPDGQTTIGKWVTICHGAIVHNATIHDWAVIGIASVVPDWAEVGEWAFIGEAVALAYRQKVPAGAMAVGNPAELTDERTSEASKEKWMAIKKTYVDLAWRYQADAKTPER